jgi:hypothetical protein
MSETVVEIEKVIEDGNGNVIEVWLLIHTPGRAPIQRTVSLPASSPEVT